MRGHVIIFEHENFQGQHRHIINEEENLNNPIEQTLNDRVSSFVVLEGIWKFYRHVGFYVPYAGKFKPGYYPLVEDYQIDYNQVSSLKCVR